MKFFNDGRQLKKAELVFMAEHWSLYLVLGIGLICLCVYVDFSKDDNDEL